MNDLLDQPEAGSKLYTTNIMDRVRHLFVDGIISLAITALIFAVLLPSLGFREPSQIDMMVYTMGVSFFYYFICEYFFGATLGKFLNKTRVITFDARKPRMLAVFIRCCLRFIPVSWMSLFFSEKLAIHDILSKTRTIRIPGYLIS